mgnify:FL=1
MEELIHHALEDTLPMIPILFLTYLLMEFIEHKSNEKFKNKLSSARVLGPLAGAVLGLIPQCGFSVIASGLYMNGTITIGTLLAVFISTSDEAIPILLSQPKQASVLVSILLVKLIIAIIVGYLVDFLVKKHYLFEMHALHNPHEHCIEEKEHSSIFYIAFIRTVKIFLFVFVVNFSISLLIHFAGEDTLKALFVEGSFLQPIVAAIVGFIPNCAASVILAQLFTDGIISFGALSAGLITSAGLGLLILLKMYDNKKDILRICVILFISAIISGVILQIV